MSTLGDRKLQKTGSEAIVKEYKVYVFHDSTHEQGFAIRD